jgi:hypothetical protein
LRLLTPPATPSGVSPTLPLLLHQLHQAYHCHQRCCHRRCCCCGQSSNRSDHHQLYPRHRSSHHRSCPQHRSFRRRLCPKRRRCHRLLCRSRRSYRCRSSPTRQFLHQQQVGRTKSGQSVVRTDGTLERDEPMAAWRQEQEGRWHAIKRGQAGSREHAMCVVALSLLPSPVVSKASATLFYNRTTLRSVAVSAGSLDFYHNVMY